MTRRKDNPPTCAQPGCAEPRYWDKRRNIYRGRYCGFHSQAHNRITPTASLHYTPAEVLAAWDKHPYGSDFRYNGRLVYGLQQLTPAVYRVQLAGLDEGVQIGAAERLERNL